MNAWKVYTFEGVYNHPITGEKFARKTKHIETVFYDDSCDMEYVRKSLINHDGYPHDIRVIKEN